MSSAVADEFARRWNALTTDNYLSSDLVKEISVEEEIAGATGETSLIVKTRDAQGKASELTLRNVNSSKSNQKLKEFAQLISNLLTGDFVSAKRIISANVTDGETSKTIPTLSVGEFTQNGSTYTATITYDGDGELTTTLGTISGNTLTVTGSTGTNAGTVSASETDNYTSASVEFSFFVKAVPSLSVGRFSQSGTTYTATISYNGDGELSTNLGTISGKKLTVEDDDGTFSGTVTASEGATFESASAEFSCARGVYKSNKDAVNKQIIGTGKDDTVEITYLKNNFYGMGNLVSTGGGDDSIESSVNDITINAGDGNDTIYHYIETSSTAGDTVSINAGNGNDSVRYGRTTKATIIGGAGDDTIINNSTDAQKARVDAGTGNDVVTVLGGNSTVYGGDGNDTMVVGSYYTRENTVYGGAGDDSIVINSRAYETYIAGRVYGETGNDTIILGNDDNGVSNATVDGGTGNDLIRARSYLNSIAGGADNDTIIGSSFGNNGRVYYLTQSTLNGGTGRDVISLDAANNSNILIQYKNGDGNDTIYGFNSTDTLSISGSYTTMTSDDDVIVTVGNGKITLVGAATVSPLNIRN